MKRKQTHVRSKSSVTTSALVGAALVASLGAAAAGFASLDTQPSFKVANAGNPTSQPLGMEVTSSTPYSFAEFSAKFDTSTTSPRELATMKALMPGEILRLEKESYTYLLYISKTDGVAYELGTGDKALYAKWAAFTKNTKTRSIKDHILYAKVITYFKEKQGVKFIRFIPGNHLITYTSPLTNKNAYAFYGADKQFYKLTNTSKEAAALLAENIPAIRITVPYFATKSNNQEVVYGSNFNNDLFPNNFASPIYQLPSDIAELQVFLADKNQAAATAKWGNDLQALVKSYPHAYKNN